MAALLDEHQAGHVTLSPAGRAAVLAALDGLRRRGLVRPVPDHPAYRAGDETIPTPPALRRYVRGDRHFALVLAAFNDHLTSHSARRYHGDRLRCAQRIAALMADPRPREDLRPAGINDPLAVALLLLLFPPAPCPTCGRPFMRESRLRVHCSDACKERAFLTGTGQPCPTLAACRECGGPLPKGRRRYCREVCKVAARNGRVRAAEAMKRGEQEDGDV